MNEGETKLPDWGAAGNDSSSESKKVLRAGRSRRRDTVLGLGSLGVLALCVGGLTVFSLQDTSGEKQQGGSDTTSDQYKAFLNDPQVQKVLKELNLGDDKEGLERKKTMLYDVNITEASLKAGDSITWGNLIAHLNTNNDAMFFGQTAALANAKCLLPTGYINRVSCEANPGFKNLNEQTKNDYIEKYNSAVDKIKKAHPSFYPSAPPKMTGVDSRKVTRRPDLRKFEANTGKRINKELRSVRRPLV